MLVEGLLVVAVAFCFHSNGGPHLDLAAAMMKQKRNMVDHRCDSGKIDGLLVGSPDPRPTKPGNKTMAASIDDMFAKAGTLL
jgi:hypothetical protein